MAGLILTQSSGIAPEISNESLSLLTYLYLVLFFFFLRDERNNSKNKVQCLIGKTVDVHTHF